MGIFACGVWHAIKKFCIYKSQDSNTKVQNQSKYVSGSQGFVYNTNLTQLICIVMQKLYVNALVIELQFRNFNLC